MQVLFRGQETDLSAAIYSILAKMRDKALADGNKLLDILTFDPFLDFELAEIGFWWEPPNSSYRDAESPQAWASLIWPLHRAILDAYAESDGDRIDLVVGPDPIQLDLKKFHEARKNADWRYTPIRRIQVVHKGRRRSLCEALNIDLELERDKWHENLNSTYSLTNRITGQVHEVQPTISDELVWRTLINEGERSDDAYFWLHNSLDAMLFIVDGEPHFLPRNAQLCDAIIAHIKSLVRYGGPVPETDSLRMHPVLLSRLAGPIIEAAELMPLSTLIGGEA